MSAATSTQPAHVETKFVQGLGLLDSTMLVAGSMIGSGVFIVSADIARSVGASGWLLLAWLVTGALTVSAALSYGELAAMMPRAGGQYVYLREAYSPLWGFLYGWTLFLVIQTGTIAAVAVAFARFLGVLVPAISSTAWIIAPINLSAKYAFSLSTQQLVAILLIALLTFINTRGLQIGKLIQNVFTSAKTLSLVALIFIGLVLARNAEVIKANFTDLWTPQGVSPVKPDLSSLSSVVATSGAFGLFIAFCVAQVGSLFSSDAWNNITFTAGEVKNPRRNIPLSLALGTGLVTALYILANLAYLCLLPLNQVQHAPDDRVATAAMETVFHGAGPLIMAVAIMISTFGCINGLILSGARVYYAMARDGLFFKATGTLNQKHVPAVALVLQGIWTCLLVLPRTRLYDEHGAPQMDLATGMQKYGNLYSNLLDYVVFAVLIFYVLTIAGLFVLRRKQPNAERPYRAFGYPVIPALYILAATVIMCVLLVYKSAQAGPGLVIVLAGVPAYLVWKKAPPENDHRNNDRAA
ncbi:MAG TPA: amino acid permease [Candidatus Binatia bacterium]|jgi:APA family basic amino acid/polyamine antiporter|nr:amino acid permease [Candidatus Binatia bacterium]